MAPAVYNLVFGGYWREVHISGIPAESGVYCVYVCRFNEAEKTVTLEDLIYIGQAEDAKARVANHEKWLLWRREIKVPGQLLCFSFAPVAIPEMSRVEAALIFQKKPTCNDTLKDSFSYEPTTIYATGRINLLTTPFTVGNNFPKPRLQT